MISLTSSGNDLSPLPNFGLFVAQGRTRVASDFDPRLGSA